MSIFDQLGTPAERVKMMLMRDLQLRRGDVRNMERFIGYHYAGGADLVIRHGEFWPGRQLPDAYAGETGQPERCYTNSLYACERRPELTYVEGYCTTGDGTAFLHGWCVDADGVVELTVPTDPMILAMARRPASMRSALPIIRAEHWGYYGVRFATQLVRDHGDSVNPIADPSGPNTRGLPLLDRSYAEVAGNDTRGDSRDFREPHDFPILKVPYDPNRTVLP